jgi:small subunit ribosomal protein S8
MNKVKNTTDRIAECLTKIRNAIGAGKETVVLPNIKIVLEILKVLSNYNYIGGYTVNEDEELVVELKIDGAYKIDELKRVSKPGVRRYIGSKASRAYKYGKGISILTTSKGVMSGRDAKKAGIGGEVLCEIW